MLCKKKCSLIYKTNLLHNNNLFHVKTPLSPLSTGITNKSFSKSKKPKSRNSFSSNANPFKLNSSFSSKKNINTTVINYSQCVLQNITTKPKKLNIKKLSSNLQGKCKVMMTQNKIEIKKDKLISFIKSKANNLRQKHKSFNDSNEYTQTKLSTETSTTSKRNNYQQNTKENNNGNNNVNNANSSNNNGHKEYEISNIITEESVFTSKTNSCQKNKSINNTNTNNNTNNVQQWDLDRTVDLSLTYSDDTVSKRKYVYDNINQIHINKKENNTRNYSNNINEHKGETINIEQQSYKYKTNYKQGKKMNSDFQSFCDEIQYRLFGN